MISITRRLEFDYGHRVLGHEGKCRHLHGHRGVVEVTVRAPRLDSLGRIIDFGVLKERIGGWIDQNWDHNVLLHPDDPLLAVPESVFAGRRPFVMPSRQCNPTAENLAAILADVAAALLPKELILVRIRFWETPNSFADFSSPPDPDNGWGGDEP